MPFDIERDSAILARTPTVVRDLLSSLDEGWTHAHYGPSTWSAHEIIGHYIHGDETDWIPRARIILNDGEDRSFTPFDRSGHITMCRERTLEELLDRFDAVRNENLDILRGLPLTPENLAKRGVHPAFGPVTLDQLLCTWVVHDLHHIGHIAKAMAHQHREDVGPWTAYLSILDPPAPR